MGETIQQQQKTSHFKAIYSHKVKTIYEELKYKLNDPILCLCHFCFMSNLEVFPVYEMYVCKTNQTRVNGQLSRHKGQNIILKLQSVS